MKAQKSPVLLKETISSSDRNCLTPDQQVSALLQTQSKRFSMKKRQKKEKLKASVKKSLNFDGIKHFKQEQKNGNAKTSQKSHEKSLSDEDSSLNDDSQNPLSKRVRKNRDQIKALHIAFEKSGGNWSKDDQTQLARQLGLNEQQVYKWSWDQMQKRRKLQEYKNSSEYAQLKQQANTDEFGGYSKTWLSKGGISSASERKMSDDFEGLDSISSLIGIDIEQKAKDIVSKKSPDGHSKRQIAKPINPNPFSIIPEFKRPDEISVPIPRRSTRNSNYSEIKPQQEQSKDKTAQNITHQDDQDASLLKQLEKNLPYHHQISLAMFKQISQTFSNKSTPNINDKPMIGGTDLNNHQSILNLINNCSIQSPFQFKQPFGMNYLNLKSQPTEEDNKNKKISMAFQNLFDDPQLPSNDEDEIEEKPLIMQKQSSYKLNSIISPINFLNPMAISYYESQQNAFSNTLSGQIRQNPFQQTPMQMHQLNSAMSQKLFVMTPSPNIRKPFTFP